MFEMLHQLFGAMLGAVEHQCAGIRIGCQKLLEKNGLLVLAGDKMVTISEVAEFIKGLGESFDDVVDGGHLLKAIKKVPAENGIYADKWLTQHKGKTYDKSTGAKAVGKEFKSAGADAGSGEGKKKASSLFDD